MKVAFADESPRNERAGQVSYLLLSPGQFGSARMAITLVDGAPGSEQPTHSHPEAEQVYVIVAGKAIMRVDDEEQEVGPGTLVFIPPGAKHAIRNVGRTPLTYVSATSPPFRMPEPGSAFAYTDRTSRAPSSRRHRALPAIAACSAPVLRNADAPPHGNPD